MDNVTQGIAFGVLFAKLNELKDKTTRELGLRWLSSSDARYGSWLWVCEELELEPDPARQMLLTARITDLDRVIKAFMETIHGAKD